MEPVLWTQGEHVAIIGDTGSGKSYLESHLLQLRTFVIVLQSKRDDVKYRGFREIRSYRQLALTHGRYILAPIGKPLLYRQATEFNAVIWHCYDTGGWTLAFDELFYATEKLKLGENIDMLLTQGRSKKLTVISGMQRPVGVTRFAISQSKHVFVFRSEGRDVKTIVEATTPRFGPMIESLQGYDFAYFNRKTREIAVGNAKSLNRIFTNATAPSH
jgi:energy-coupling factor transporter ATP-binding protein EcfA2